MRFPKVWLVAGPQRRSTAGGEAIGSMTLRPSLTQPTGKQTLKTTSSFLTITPLSSTIPDGSPELAAMAAPPSPDPLDQLISR